MMSQQQHDQTTTAMIPKEFLCPITHEIMSDPVLAEDGHSYERVAITRWFSTNQNRSPVTNEELPRRTLLPNHALRKIIDHYRYQLGIQILIDIGRVSSDSLMEGHGEDWSQCFLDHGGGVHDALDSTADDIDPKNDDEHAKMKSIVKQLYRSIRLMVDNGADINVRDKDGRSLLMVALIRQHYPVAEFLLSRGINVLHQDDKGETAISTLENQLRNAPSDRIPARLLQKLRDMAQIEERKIKLNDAAKKKERQEWQQRQQNLADLFGSMGNNSDFSAASGFGPGIGFFPSLFGLQFQRISSNSEGYQVAGTSYNRDSGAILGSSSEGHRDDGLPVGENRRQDSDRLMDGAHQPNMVLSFLGLVALTLFGRTGAAAINHIKSAFEGSEEAQQLILSRFLLILGSTVLLVLLVL